MWKSSSKLNLQKIFKIKNLIKIGVCTKLKQTFEVIDNDKKGDWSNFKLTEQVMSNFMIPKMTVVFRDKKRNGVKAQKVKANYNLSDDQGQWLTQIEKQIWSSPSYWKSKKRFIDQLKHTEQLEYQNDRKIKFQNSKSKRGGILTKIKHGEKQFFEDPLF